MISIKTKVADLAKKPLALVLVMALMFSSGVGVYAADSEKRVSAAGVVPADITGTVYEEAVKALMEKEIITGYPDGNYHPGDKVNRAQMCVMVINAADITPEAISAMEEANYFSDMSGFGWAEKQINYAVSVGIVSGYSDGTFRPGAEVTYVEAAAMLINAMGYRASDIKGTWPDNYASKARELGLFKTVANPVALSISMSANRGDTANMLYAVVDKISAANLQPIKKDASKKEDSVVQESSAAAIQKENIVPTMNFTGDPIKLSLKDAIKTMQTTGTKAETAQLNHQSDQSIADGYAETTSTIKDTLDKISEMGAVYGSSALPVVSAMEGQGATASNRKIMQLRRDFARQELDHNYQAELNQIEYDTVNTYYGVLLAQENVETAKENLKTQKDILKNTQLKFDVGMVAQKDILSAQSAVTAAESAVQEAQTTLNTAKMGLNYYLGYPVMQSVELSDTLESTVDQIPENKAVLSKAIADAIDNRIEVRGATFAVEVNKILLDSLRYIYPTSSSTYKKQEVAYLKAKQQAEDAPSQIEMDIRSKYTALQDKKAALESAKSTEAFAKEGFRLINLSYEAGMATLSEVQDTQVKVYQAGMGVTKAMIDYVMANYDLQFAMGVGTTRLPL